MHRAVNPVLLALLLSADVVFIVVHVSAVLATSPNTLLFLDTDSGYAEAFQYIKESWIAILLFAMCWRSREAVYGAWALLFAYLLCDDALSFHERIGSFIVNTLELQPAFRLRAQDFGELTASAAAGTAFLLVIGYLYGRAGNDARNASKDLVLLLAVLAFFGVFVDMLHIAVMDLPIRGLTLVEDGGEMVTMSVITAYAMNLLDGQRHVAGTPWNATWAALTGLTRRFKRR